MYMVLVLLVQPSSACTECFFLEASRISVCMIILKHLLCCSTTSNDHMALAVFALAHILTVFGLVCDVMLVMQLSIMQHNGKEKLVIGLQALKKSIME